MNSLELLGGLLKGYFLEGTSFFLLHLLVVYLVSKSWRRITREADALDQWRPKEAGARGGQEKRGRDISDGVGLSAPAPDGGRGDTTATSGLLDGSGGQHETTDVMDQFVRESDQLGPQGMFVPISDFSDRLDSVVDGMIAELHDRTNLFLIIGIAGTLFGVFEFAFKSYNVLISGDIAPGDRIFKLGEFLSGSMAKAFPVGFAGLIFTFISQIMTASPETKLRKALSKATHLALLRRQRESQSQAELVRNAVNSQAELVRGSVGEIKEAMQPLADLRVTLTQTIEPVIKTFGERLEQSLKLVEAQFNKLEETTGGLQDAVGSVRAGVDSLQVAADSLKALTADTPAAIRNIIEMQEQQKGSLTAFGESFGEHLAQAREINDLILASTDNLEQSARTMLQRATDAMGKVGEESVQIWRGASVEFARQLGSDSRDVLTRSEGKINESLNSMSAALGAMSRAAAEVGESLESVRSLPADIRAELESAFGGVKQQSVELWGSMAEDLGRSTQFVLDNYFDQIKTGAGAAAGSLVKAADAWERLAQNSEPLLKEPVREAISHAKNEISESLAKADRQLNVRLPQVSQDLQSLASGLSGLLGQVRDLNTAFGEWSSGAGQALNDVSEFHLRLSQLLRDLTAIEGLRDAKEILPRLDAGISDLAVIRARMDELKAAADQHADERSKGGIFSIFGR